MNTIFRAGCRPKNFSMFLNTIKDEILPALCSEIPCGFWSGVTRINPLIAYYHTVSNEDIPHVKHLYTFRNVAQFKMDIDAFCKQFRPIGLHDLLENMKTRRPLPRNSILLTFDDGLSEIFHVIAPILREKGVPATFFLTTACLDNKDMAHHNKISILVERVSEKQSGLVEKEALEVLSQYGNKKDDVRTALLQLDYREREAVARIAQLLDVDFNAYLSTRQPYLTSEQVRQLIKMGFTIGGHSVDHPLYATLSLEEQLSQTTASVRIVRDRFSLNYGAFAFPHGDQGVSARFFSNLFSGTDVDISFGTRGLLRETIPQHFQRFSMENTSAPAERVVARNYARGFYKKLIGRAIVDRNSPELQRS